MRRSFVPLGGERKNGGRGLGRPARTEVLLAHSVGQTGPGRSRSGSCNGPQAGERYPPASFNPSSMQCNSDHSGDSQLGDTGAGHGLNH